MKRRIERQGYKAMSERMVGIEGASCLNSEIRRLCYS